MDKRESAISKIREWRARPAKFAYDNFGVTLDKWQEKALEAFADPTKPRIALVACAGVGKSALLSMAGWNFLTCYAEKGEHPKAAAISITASNLKDNLWSELSRWQSRSPFLMKAFKWTSERISAVDHPNTWFMSARSYAQSANSEEIGRTLSGLHSKYILYLLDETGDMPESIINSANQGLSTGPKFGKILIAGNPTSHGNMLHCAATKYRDQWHIINITGDPDREDRSTRVDINYAREQIRAKGRDDPWIQSYLLGEFPDASINTLISIAEAERAARRKYTEKDIEFAQKRLSIDVALGGLDKTIITPRQGLQMFKCIEMSTDDPRIIAARIMDAKAKWNSEIEILDNTAGFGSGVCAALRDAGQSPYPVHFAGKAPEAGFYNMRSYMYFKFRDWIRSGGAIPDDPDLIKQITAPMYSLKQGRIILEDKDLIKKRLGFSPDRADSAVLSFAIPDMPTQLGEYAFINKDVGKMQWDYDPFANS